MLQVQGVQSVPPVPYSCVWFDAVSMSCCNSSSSDSDIESPSISFPGCSPPPGGEAGPSLLSSPNHYPSPSLARYSTSPFETRAKLRMRWMSRYSPGWAVLNWTAQLENWTVLSRMKVHPYVSRAEMKNGTPCVSKADQTSATKVDARRFGSQLTSKRMQSRDGG